MKFELTKLIRPNIAKLQPYTSLREKYKEENLVLMDANENPRGEFNRYPDAQQQELKTRLAQLNAVQADQLFLGNGSDELLDLVMRAFCEPREDAVMVMDPSFVMVQFYAQVNDIKVEKIPLNPDFQLDKSFFDELNKNSTAKILYLCSPNNPTGNCLNHLEYYIGEFKGIVLLDEAYIEFSERSSLTVLLSQYPNLIILKTLSKAYGMAGLRVGMGISSPEIAAFINLLKPPYNISSESQRIALQLLEDETGFRKNLEIIMKEKLKLEQALSKIPLVQKIYPSEANFFLIEVEAAQKVHQYLINHNILTSLRHPALKNCLRISIGSPEENLKLIQMLKNYN